nr:MAG TPA: hypothetical protein [Caudoviricetes sp.]
MNQDYSLKEDLKHMDYEDLQQAANTLKNMISWAMTNGEPEWKIYEIQLKEIKKQLKKFPESKL